MDDPLDAEVCMQNVLHTSSLRFFAVPSIEFSEFSAESGDSTTDTCGDHPALLNPRGSPTDFCTQAAVLQ